MSYALHGAGLLDTPLDSSGLAAFGRRGRGEWVTVYGNPGHAYMVVAGLRFDTSSRQEQGNRWTARKALRERLRRPASRRLLARSRGSRPRHPAR